MIFHEAPHKLVRTLADMLDAWGDRELTLCRELTKLHEEFIRTTLSEALERYTLNPPKGEFVLVIRGAEEQPDEAMTKDDALAMVRRLRADGTKLKDACKEAAEASGISKNELYQAILAEEN